MNQLGIKLDGSNPCCSSGKEPSLPTELPPIGPLLSARSLLDREITIGEITKTIREIYDAVLAIDRLATLSVKGSFAYSLLTPSNLPTLPATLVEERLREQPHDLDLFILFSIPIADYPNQAAEAVLKLFDSPQVPFNRLSKSSRDQLATLFLPGVDLSFVASQRRPLGIVTHGSLSINLATGEVGEGGAAAIYDWIYKIIRPCHAGIYDPYDLSKIISLLLRGYRPTEWGFVQEAAKSAKAPQIVFDHLKKQHLRDSDDLTIALMQLIAIIGSPIPITPPGRFALLFTRSMSKEALLGYIQLTSWWEKAIQLPEKKRQLIIELFASNSLDEPLLDALFQTKQTPSSIRDATLSKAISTSTLSSITRSFLLYQLAGEPLEKESIFEELGKDPLSPLEKRVLSWMEIQVEKSPRERQIAYALLQPASYILLKKLAPFSELEVKSIFKMNPCFGLRVIRESSLLHLLPKVLKSSLAAREATRELLDLIQEIDYLLGEEEEKLLARHPDFQLLAPHFKFTCGKYVQWQLQEMDLQGFNPRELWALAFALKSHATAEFKSKVIAICREAPSREKLAFLRTAETVRESLKEGSLTYGELQASDLTLFAKEERSELSIDKAIWLLEKGCYLEAAELTETVIDSIPTRLISKWEEVLSHKPPAEALKWVEKNPLSQKLVNACYVLNPASRPHLFTKVNPSEVLRNLTPEEALALLLLLLQNKIETALDETEIDLLLPHCMSSHLLLLTSQLSPFTKRDTESLARARAKLYREKGSIELLNLLSYSPYWAEIEKDILSQLLTLDVNQLVDTQAKMRVATALLHCKQPVSVEQFLFVARTCPDREMELFELGKRVKKPSSLFLMTFVTIGVNLISTLEERDVDHLILSAERIKEAPWPLIIRQLLSRQNAVHFLPTLLKQISEVAEEDIAPIVHLVSKSNLIPTGLTGLFERSLNEEACALLFDTFLKNECNSSHAITLLQLLLLSLQFDLSRFRTQRVALTRKVLMIREQILIKKASSTLIQSRDYSHILLTDDEQLFFNLGKKVLEALVEKGAGKEETDPYVDSPHLMTFSARALKGLFLMQPDQESKRTNRIVLALLELLEEKEWEEKFFIEKFRDYLARSSRTLQAEIASELTAELLLKTFMQSSLPAFCYSILLLLLESNTPMCRKKLFLILHPSGFDRLKEKINQRDAIFLLCLWNLQTFRTSVSIYEKARQAIAIIESTKPRIDPLLHTIQNEIETLSEGYIFPSQVKVTRDLLIKLPKIKEKTKCAGSAQHLEQLLKAFRSFPTPPTEPATATSHTLLSFNDLEGRLERHPLLQDRLIFALIELASNTNEVTPLMTFFRIRQQLKLIDLKWVSDFLGGIFVNCANVNFLTCSSFQGALIEITAAYADLLEKETELNELTYKSIIQFSLAMIRYLPSEEKFHPLQQRLSSKLFELGKWHNNPTAMTEAICLESYEYDTSTYSHTLSPKGFLQAVALFFTRPSPLSIARGYLRIGLNFQKLPSLFTGSDVKIRSDLKRMVNSCEVLSSSDAPEMITLVIGYLNLYLVSEEKKLKCISGLVALLNTDCHLTWKPFTPDLILHLFAEMLPGLSETYSDPFFLELHRFLKLLPQLLLSKSIKTLLHTVSTENEHTARSLWNFGDPVVRKHLTEIAPALVNSLSRT